MKSQTLLVLVLSVAAHWHVTQGKIGIKKKCSWYLLIRYWYYIVYYQVSTATSVIAPRMSTVRRHGTDGISSRNRATTSTTPPSAWRRRASTAPLWARDASAARVTWTTSVWRLTFLRIRVSTTHASTLARRMGVTRQPSYAPRSTWNFCPWAWRFSTSPWPTTSSELLLSHLYHRLY